MLAELNLATMGLAGLSSEAFRTALPLALVGVLVVVVGHLLLTLARRRGGVARSGWNFWEWLIYLGTLASVTVLGLTSFVGMLCFGTLGGWWLFIHMVGAGAFTVALPLWAITWCEAHRFGRPPQAAGAETPPATRFLQLAKVMFWVLLAGGLVVSGTMLLSMLPLFGTHGLEVLLDVHRLAGLAVVVAAILHVYAALLPRFGVS
jgi:cytochrome b subunit of formate dehydrogenase